ncbi:hypothetical protein E4U58_004523 [Claviceps cyperi]|nr:hypothetical protein E4U58_004523 [Claviceps cyperi]
MQQKKSHDTKQIVQKQPTLISQPKHDEKEAMSVRILPVPKREEPIMEGVDEPSIMSPETRSPLNGADDVSSGQSEPLAVVYRDIEAPFLAAMQTALHALNDLLENRERQQEMAVAEAEEYYPLGYSEDQWFRLLKVFLEFVQSRIELRRAIAEARRHWLIDHDTHVHDA